MNPVTQQNGGMHRAGIDLGGTFTKLALVGPRGEIWSRRSLPARIGCEPRVVFGELRRNLEEMARAAGLPYPPAAGCGIGVPGLVDSHAGRLMLSGPLGWADLDLAGAASAELGCPAVVDTDVNAGALADLYFGNARDASDMVYVSWGTGIGAALVAGRRVYRTRGGAMCNLGHAPADSQSTRHCYCGADGCLEVEAGGKAIVAKARERILRGEPTALRDEVGLTPGGIAEAAAAGDGPAVEVLRDAAVLMARALAGVMAFLNPDTVVLGGGVSQCLPLVRESFDAELERRTPAFSLPLTRIRMSAFGDAAGVIGAAMLTAERVAAEPSQAGVRYR